VDKVFIAEKNHVEKIKDSVKKALSNLEQILRKVGVTNLDRLKELKQEGEFGPDFLMYLEQLHEKNAALNLKGKFKRMEELKYLLSQPYFARIDLKGGGKAEKVYIGKFGLPESPSSVTDWRAKIASVYYRYRYPQKDIYYDTPGGVEKKDLLLKRTYEIADGELIKYYNNDIQLDENEIIIDKIGKKTGGVLEDIIETIQQSQMDIIESDPRQICIVQGCVGSGKSTVAIHKLAHIFFNYPNLIHSEKSIVVAKNQILVGYLSTLFPRLGIFDINYKTVREMVVNLIFREQIQIKTDLDNLGDLKGFKLEDLNNLYISLEKIHATYEKKLSDLFKVTEFEPFGGYRYSTNMSPFENINEILTELEEEISNQKDELKELPNDSIKAYLCRENLKSLRKLVNKLSDMKNDIKTNSVQEVAKSFGVDTKKSLTYAETILYVYIYLSLMGIHKHPTYEYCVVDEGQDFSPLEYAIMSKVVLRGRFGIFGDLNQSLDPSGIERWEDLFEIIKEAKSSVRFELSTNYRSTKPIIDLARKILNPFTNNFMPESINRMGAEPLIRLVENNAQVMNEFLSAIKKEAKDLDKSIGVICHDDTLLDQVSREMKKLIKNPAQLVILDSGTRVNYIPKGVYVMNSINSKGLEFSKVYVLGLNPEKIESFDEARKAFVVTTRAMNELVIYGVRDHEKTN